MVMPPAGRAAGAAFALWALAVLGVALTLGFGTPPGRPPLPIAVAVLAPLAVFAAALATSRSFRELVLAADLRWLTAMQAWRFVGFDFLALYAHGVLPGVFAWPAGLGDAAVALAAPWMVLRLSRDPAYAGSRGFIAWNVLGIVDLLVAIGIGATASILATGAPGEVTTAPMAQLPLVLIPAFFVPAFLMLHVAMLLQVRRLRAGR
jgi:hypothetical protein